MNEHVNTLEVFGIWFGLSCAAHHRPFLKDMNS